MGEESSAGRTASTQGIANPLQVMLDSNSLIKEQLLTTFIGHSFIDQLTKFEGKLIISDIIKREALSKLMMDATANIQRLEQYFDLYNRVLDRDIKNNLLSLTDIEAGYQRLLSEMAPLMVEEIFNFEKASRALERIFAKRAPCGSNNEQFRDACIWEDCLHHAKTGTLLFITNDNAFYDKDRKSVASDIKEDIERRNVDIRVFRSLNDAVDLMAPNAPERDLSWPKNKLASKLKNIVRNDIKYPFSIQSLTNMDVKLKQTNNPSVALFLFEASFSVLDRTLFSSMRANPSAVLSGSARLNLIDSRVSAVSISEVNYSWRDESGMFGEEITRFHRSSINF